MATWLVLHKKHSGYGDVLGETYEYPLGIANSKQIKVGDHIVFCLTKYPIKDDKRILGYGRIKNLEPRKPLADDSYKRQRIAAHLENYRKFTPALSFNDIGGDPRSNGTNSINRIQFDFQLYSSTRIETPIDDDYTNKQYYARTVRKGQPKLRELLLKEYDYRCTISGHGPTNVLEACHIIPHNVSGNNQLDNALLLRSDLHCLFDDSLLKINPNTYTIEIDQSIIKTPYGKLHGKSLRKRLDGSYPKVKFLKSRYKN
ncbi:HNH endonuclease [Maribacter aestuarii]|uniref:HNH endonuclease n=1 Tax=Maribacter aestuarii TaxID=1130723 RepID=UPI00248BD94A|nr:HNH endonuclease [Maribacter aestuarii]